MKKKMSVWCLSFFLCSLLLGQESLTLHSDEAMVVNSGEAQYDGKEIVLTGHVVVQHPLGQISADRLAVLPLINQEKKTKFGLLKMQEDVCIQLKDGGQLSCQEAEVDYSKMKGVMLGNQEHPDVLYFNPGEEGREGKPSIELKSLKMTFEISKEPSQSSSSSKALVKEIRADQNVRVWYNKEYLLLSDHAIYQRIADDKSAIAGLLTLTAKEDLPLCTMTNLKGDRLYGQTIELNTIQRKLWFDKPEGKLYFPRENHPDDLIEFSSAELMWDDPQQQILLRGSVKMTQNHSLCVMTSGEMIISQGIVQGKRTLRLLQCPEDTQMMYDDPEQKTAGKMDCPGPLVINHEAQTITLEGLSALDAEGKRKNQVYIQSLMGDLYADRAEISYRWVDRKIIVETMMLEGNVQLIHRFVGPKQELGAVLHIALADKLECFPQKHDMIFTSDKGKRVLFFDKANNIQMSAPSLKVRHDPLTKKETIQGVGDVRFTFIEKEMEELKHHFWFQKGGLDGKSIKNK